MKILTFAVAATIFLLTGCASSGGVVSGDAPPAAIGRTNDVKLTAQLSTAQFSAGVPVRLTYELENLRSTAVAFAELVPETSYDRAAKIITVSLGTEVPGNEMLPRLVQLLPGEKRSFSTGVRLPLVARGGAGEFSAPQALQVKANFLGRVEPFTALIGVSERVVHSPKLADELFAAWLEHNETILTNAIPISWGARVSEPQAPIAQPARRRRGGT